MKNNQRLLVMMVTSALMTCPAWANAAESATATQTTSVVTGYEPEGVAATTVQNTPETTVKKAASTTTKAATKAANTEVNPTISGTTGYEPAGSESIPASAKSSTPATAHQQSAQATAEVNPTITGGTGYEPAGSENTPITTAPTTTTTTVAPVTPVAPATTVTEPAPAETPAQSVPEKAGDQGMLVVPVGGKIAIDSTTYPKYPMAILTANEASSLPYGNAIADSDVKPYAGKVATSVNITPLPEAGMLAKIQPSLAMRQGDAINVDYIRHDVNAIGGLGLFATVTPVFQEVPEGVALNYVVKTNPVVNRIDITGNHFYKTEDLMKLVTTQPGSVMNNIQAGQDVAAINNKYSTAGYILSHVINTHLDEAGVLHFVINEGHLEDVIVKGNTKTKTYVITREMKLKKGQLFNKDLARRSVERIYNTGYFEDVNVRLLPGKINKNDVIMEIDVTEQKTGTVTVGAGYSDSDGLVGILGLSESNFRGIGDQISINWEFGGSTNTTRNYVFSYNRPWINDHGDSLGFSVFDREADYEDYNQKGDSVAEYYKRTKGGNITYGRVRSDFVKDYVTLETKNTDYTEYKSGYDYRNYDGYLDKNFGRTNSVTWSHVFDNRDNVYDPSRGKRLSFTGIVAGHGIGGDFDFYKMIAESRTYYKVGRAHVITVRLMGGIGFGDMPYSDLFSLGGADTLRGYEDDEFRGNRFYEGTVEYRYPIAKKVQGVFFTDIGNAWGGTSDIFWYEENNKVHYAGGLGLRITTPIGPIRLDYGRGSEGGKFHFSFGGKF